MQTINDFKKCEFPFSHCLFLFLTDIKIVRSLRRHRSFDILSIFRHFPLKTDWIRIVLFLKNFFDCTDYQLLQSKEIHLWYNEILQLVFIQGSNTHFRCFVYFVPWGTSAKLFLCPGAVKNRVRIYCGRIIVQATDHEID